MKDFISLYKIVRIFENFWEVVNDKICLLPSKGLRKDRTEESYRDEIGLKLKGKKSEYVTDFPYSNTGGNTVIYRSQVP